MLPIERVAFKLAVGNFKKKWMKEINFPNSRVHSFLSFAAKIPFPFRGSFAVHSEDHFRSNLGIIHLRGRTKTGLQSFRENVESRYRVNLHFLVPVVKTRQDVYINTFPLCDRKIYCTRMASNNEKTNVEEKRTENETGE